MIHLTIDGKEVSVEPGTTVYKAAQKLGINVPIFCYQDRMPPFGACRVCLVEVEKMGKLQTSCTLEAKEGMVVKTQSTLAVEGRKSILEFLLINHPLDCPICDKGGECPLQDQALSDGPGESRFYEEKRHFPKPLPLGPVLMLDRERCIVCARCTRFSDEIAGDHALEFVDRGFRTEVGTPGNRPAESKFIGNTIKICPVGALTSQVYRFRARPWDNDETESTCTLCPVGCSLYLDARDGEIMRTRSREDKKVNDIWMCDKGWFGYEFSSSPDRLTRPLIRKNGKLEESDWDEALSLIAKSLQGKKKVAGWGGNPLTTEENYLFQKLFREGLGVSNLDHRIGEVAYTPEEEGIPSGMEMEIGECDELSYIYLLGLDITEEFPVIWLRLRQALNRGAKIVFLGHYAPEVSKHLTRTIVHAPGQELEQIKAHVKREEGKGAIFVGRQYLNHPARKAILAALLELSLPLNLMEGRGNSMGASYAGMRPNKGGLNALEVVQSAAQSGWDLLYVAGCNPAVKFPSKLWEKARHQLDFLVVQDIFLTETAAQADVVLPTLCYVEKGGSFMNIEGRIQKLRPGKKIPEGLLSDGEIFVELAKRLSIVLEVDASFSTSLLQERIPVKRSISVESALTPLAGDLKATFSRVLFDRGVRMRHNPHVLKLVKEPKVRLHPREGEKRGLKSGDKIKVSTPDNAIAAFLHLDHEVAEGTVVLPLGFSEVPVHDLALQLMNGLAVEIQPW